MTLKSCILPTQSVYVCHYFLTIYSDNFFNKINRLVFITATCCVVTELRLSLFTLQNICGSGGIAPPNQMEMIGLLSGHGPFTPGESGPVPTD
jgi:hypothetical protein